VITIPPFFIIFYIFFFSFFFFVNFFIYLLGITVFSPLKRNKVGPGVKVGVVGIGGLGHLAVQFAAALGAEVYDHSSSHLL
jgi:hypothetical protein